MDNGHLILTFIIIVLLLAIYFTPHLLLQFTPVKVFREHQSPLSIVGKIADMKPLNVVNTHPGPVFFSQGLTTKMIIE